MNSKSKIAVIGLGIMGHGVADNFLKNGYEVSVWNRTQGKCADLVKNGATLASSIKEAVQDADLIFEVTASDISTRAIWFGDGGILENANSDQTLITFATLSIEYTKELSEACEEKGFTFFDMPMTGGRTGAETGNLILLVGGDEKKLDALREDLKAISTEVKYFGPATSGMKFKLILNYAQAVHISLFGDAMRLAKKVGLDLKSVGDILVERPGGMHFNIAWDAFNQPPKNVSFSVDWIAKDLGYCAELDNDVDHPYLDAVLNIYKDAIARGDGEQDWTSVNK